MKPIRNWLLGFCSGAGGAAIEGVTGVAAGRREASRRVARLRMLESKGTSEDDYMVYAERSDVGNCTCQDWRGGFFEFCIGKWEIHTRVYIDGTCRLRMEWTSVC